MNCRKRSTADIADTTKLSGLLVLDIFEIGTFMEFLFDLNKKL
jgi:hypothetical protein